MMAVSQVASKIVYKKQIKQLEDDKGKLIDKLMDTQISAVIEAYEKKIETIERERLAVVEKMRIFTKRKLGSFTKKAT